MKRTLTRNTIINMLNVGWGLAFALILPPFVIRTLGKETYGIWVLVTSFSVLTGYLSVLDLGLQTAIVKYVAEHHARAEYTLLNQLVGNALTAYLLLGSLSGIGLALFATFGLQVFHIPPQLVATTRLLLYILSVQVFFEFPGLAFSGVLEGLQRYDALRLIDMLRLLIYALLVFFALARGYGVIALGLITALMMIGRVIVMQVISKRLLPSLSFAVRFDGQTIRHILGFTGKILVIRINAVIYNQMDKAIIGILLISTLLTDYDIANKIHSLVLTSLSLISALLVPTASGLAAQANQAGLRKLFLRATKYTAALCLPTTIGAMLLAKYIIRYWIGPEYVYNTGLTQLFLIYLLFTVLVPVGQNMMIGMDQFAPMLLILVITTIINLVFSIVLTYFVGIAGVVLGTLIGTALAAYPYLRHFLSILQISWGDFTKQVLLRTYPQALLCAAVLFLVVQIRAPGNLLEVAVWGGGTELFYLFLFGLSGLEIDERQTIVAQVSHQLRRIMP